MFYSTHYSSPVGSIMLASDSENLVGLWIEGQKDFAAGIKGAHTKRDDCPVLLAAKKWLDAYFHGQRPGISDLPLAPAGGKFRKQVWEILCAIPYGQTITYKEIASEMATRMKKASMSAQAVGGAVGHNPISIIIPCHRVVGSNGSLTGYAGGIEKKIKLLKHEGADMASLFVPSRGTAL